MKLLLATGGSGGHIFPALETALQLRKRGHDIVFAGALGMAYEKIVGLGFTCHSINAHGFKNKTLIGVYRFLRAMLGAYQQARMIIKEEKPDKVLGFGGYGSFAVVAAARALKIPTMIHEQNVIPGKANALLARFVPRIAISFKESARYFDARKTLWTGCPCHDHPSGKSKNDIYSMYGLNPQKKTIVLLGGSQGSQKLNAVFFECIGRLLQEGKYQAIHMTGKSDYGAYRSQYAQTQIPVIVKDFISPIEDMYAIADVIITRSGAATVSEIGAFGIPAIFIPYPFAGGHQKFNAQVLTKLGVACVIDQEQLNLASLRETMLKLQALCLDRALIKERTKDLFVDNPAERLAIALEQCS